jgi:hypothetical protein
LEKGFRKTPGNSENYASLGYMGMPVSFYSILSKLFIVFILESEKKCRIIQKWRHIWITLKTLAQ